MKKHILIVLVTMVGLAGAVLTSSSSFRATAQEPKRAEPPSALNRVPLQSSKNKLGYFDYTDTAGGIKARVFLPESMGEWAVENPWRDSEKSLLKEPQVFVKANFQSVAVPAFYGLVRVVLDLKGYDCGTVFTKLSELDGLTLQKYSDTAFEGIKNGKLYVFEYSAAKNNLIIGSKALCDDKTGIEVIVIAPNEAKYKDPVNSILRDVEMTIPATPAK
jgi:hypothetical protein